MTLLAAMTTNAPSTAKTDTTELPVAVAIRYKEHHGVYRHYPVDANGDVIEGRYTDAMPVYALPADYHTSTTHGQDRYGVITSPYERRYRK